MEQLVIYKYPLNVLEVTTLTLPIGARFLTVQEQDGIPVIWVMINLNESAQAEYSIVCVGTGFELPPYFDKDWNYVNTVQIDYLVNHVFWKYKYEGEF